MKEATPERHDTVTTARDSTRNTNKPLTLTSLQMHKRHNTSGKTGLGNKMVVPPGSLGTTLTDK